MTFPPQGKERAGLLPEEKTFSPRALVSRKAWISSIFSLCISSFNTLRNSSIISGGSCSPKSSGLA